MTRELIFAALGLVTGIGLVWLLWQRRRPASPDVNFQLLQTGLHERLDRVMEQLNLRLQENVQAMNESKSFLANRVSTTEQSVRQISATLGRLEEATAAVQRTNQEIAEFQTMLRAPKIRGAFGEMLLTNLLTDYLPLDRFSTQYTLHSTGEIADAIIYLQDDFKVCVDAKFPLANYEHYIHATDESEKHALRKLFLRDVKKHILDIASKYIVPQERTLDYAFMYIPIESVYYETIMHDAIDDNLLEFCLNHKVIPISPNSFMAYLQTILVGLRGLKVEEQAQEILQSLRQFRHDFTMFSKDFAMVGTHITNAKNRFDDSTRKLDRFSQRLDTIEENTTSPELSAETVSEIHTATIDHQ